MYEKRYVYNLNDAPNFLKSTEGFECYNGRTLYPFNYNSQTLNRVDRNLVRYYFTGI